MQALRRAMLRPLAKRSSPVQTAGDEQPLVWPGGMQWFPPSPMHRRGNMDSATSTEDGAGLREMLSSHALEPSPMHSRANIAHMANAELILCPSPTNRGSRAHVPRVANDDGSLQVRAQNSTPAVGTDGELVMDDDGDLPSRLALSGEFRARRMPSATEEMAELTWAGGMRWMPPSPASCSTTTAGDNSRSLSSFGCRSQQTILVA
eukprot:gnl/TRDRNA2_/TRDRNA2_182821_c0_seq1.p1 gnl/TRDRNA2_/TRDRNA2_182821_c0~~gnl/TRDRNA2_/TRDRNA2_182821_c0_seq1.p1  ORF type:complete len:206 (-),score=32.90 gnl/TRDRNA2_/TRDRNA2_182821_c0_seq1:106-723(-)